MPLPGDASRRFHPLENTRIVDLTHVLRRGAGVEWPTHGPFLHSATNWFAPAVAPNGDRLSADLGDYYTAQVTLDEHTGTHADAPAHHIPPPDSGLPGAAAAGKITAEHLSLRNLMGPARVIDVRSRVQRDIPPGVSPRIGTEVLNEYEAATGPVLTGDAVLLHTGWDEVLLGQQADAYVRLPLLGRAPGWPAPSEDLIAALLERGVLVLGTDAPSMGAADDGKPVHVNGLGAGMVFIEQLTGLSEVPPTGAFFLFLGLKLENGSGSPGRAVAYVPDAV